MYFKCLLIEKDQYIHSLLSKLLDDYFNDIEIIQSAYSGEQGIIAINSAKPDLIFLGMDLGDMKGMEMLLKLGELSSHSFHTVFIGNYQHFSEESIHLASISYLPKPINLGILTRVIHRFKTKKNKQFLEKGGAIPTINHQADLETFNGKENLTLLLQKGELSIPIQDILYLQGDRNYTYIYSKGGNKTLVSKTLSYFEELIDTAVFFRCHKSFIVNRLHIDSQASKQLIALSDNTKIPVSRRKRTDFWNWLQAPLK